MTIQSRFDEKIEEYARLMRLYANLVASTRGKEVEVWQNDTQTLATKLFCHLGTIYYLFKETKLPELEGITIDYIDCSSIIVLIRTSFETYFTFYYIYRDPSRIQEQHFRHSLWKLGGLKHRQRFPVFTEESREKLEAEKALIEKLEKEIESNPLYTELSDRKQKLAIDGIWSLGKSWAQLAKIASFDEEIFGGIYGYLCSHAHAGYISAIQIGLPIDRETRLRLSISSLDFGLILMSHFIFSYITIFPEAARVLKSFPDSANIARFWSSITMEKI